MLFLLLVVALASYLFGSFPAGYFAGRIAGVDIRTFGSGNIGATNVLRALGKKWGYAVFFVDAFKGFCAVRLAVFLAAAHAGDRAVCSLLWNLRRRHVRARTHVSGLA